MAQHHSQHSVSQAWGARARWLVERLAPLFVRLYLRTLRVAVVTHPSLDPSEHRPWVLCFFHGEQFPLLAWPRRRSTSVLVSWSLDGELQARILRGLSMRVERGSSSRGGSRGLRAVLAHLRQGCDAAFAVDGPRGPLGVAKPGARLAARAAGARLVPMSCICRRSLRFRRAWDRYCLPLPFSLVVVGLGAPLEAQVASEEELSRAIAGVAASLDARLAC